MDEKFSSVLFGEIPLFQVQHGRTFSPDMTEVLLEPVRSDLGMFAQVFCVGCGRYFQVDEERYREIAGVPSDHDMHGKYLDVSGCSCCTGQPKTGRLKHVLEG